MDGGLRAIPRQERSERTIARLIDATQRVLDRAGRDGATTTAIAAEAGVSVGRLYYWFPDLHTLLAAAATHAASTFGERLDAVRVAARGQSFGHAIEHLVTAVADGVWSHPGVAELLVGGSEHSASPDGGAMRQALQECLNDLVELYVPTTSAGERAIVTTVATEMVVAGTAAMLTVAAPLAEQLEHEVVYALVAYLSTRYPSAGDLGWFDDDRPARPVRPAVRGAWRPGVFAPGASSER